MATSSRRSGVLSAINSLANDGIVRLSSNDYAQFEALVQDYFDKSDDSSDDKISDQEGKECDETTAAILLTAYITQRQPGGANERNRGLLWQTQAILMNVMTYSKVIPRVNNKREESV